MQDEYTPDLVSLSDEEGNEYNFEVLDAIETDEAKYVALTPVYDDGKEPEDDEANLVIMKVFEEESGENFFEEIEDDDEYETIADAFVSRLQDYFEIDEK